MTILFQGQFWNIVAGLGQGGAGAVVAIVVLLYFQSKQPKNGNGSKSPTAQCIFANPDSSQVRAMEIGNHVTSYLGPKLDEQTRLLQSIRDGVRDLKG